MTNEIKPSSYRIKLLSPLVHKSIRQTLKYIKEQTIGDMSELNFFVQ